MLIPIDKINITGGTQPRESINYDIVDEYAEKMSEGEKFPPVVVFDDGSTKWLAAGFHRFHATNKVGFKDIEAEVKQGSRRDAILYAVGTNTDHGLRRTNEDKRKSVMMLLNDEEWAQWSNMKIAKQCAVDEVTVRKYRDGLSSEIPKIDAHRKVERNGVTYEQNTANIGKRKEEPKSVVCEANMPIVEDDDCVDDVVEAPSRAGTVTAAYVYADAAISQLSKIQKWDKEGIKELNRVAAFIEKKKGELSK